MRRQGKSIETAYAIYRWLQTAKEGETLAYLSVDGVKVLTCSLKENPKKETIIYYDEFSGPSAESVEDATTEEEH